jgi:trimeric autotransporter adhesin
VSYSKVLSKCTAARLLLLGAVLGLLVSVSAGLSSLPLAPQNPILAVLGRHDSGYWVHRNGEGFRAENPRHALVAEFTRQGTEVRSHDLRWRLETRGYGYGDSMHPLRAVAPQATANRVEYRRDELTEWYENGPLGLEQGFTLAHRPGNANGQPLTLELRLKGDLVAALDAGGKALELSRNNGEAALRYTGLNARDATGRELRSWLEVRGERLLVRVEDTGARYPVVVDPWIQQQELTASDGATSDQFGFSVAVSGSTIVVGAIGHTEGSNVDQGVAYVFEQNGDGTWSQQAELTASDGAVDDNFGTSVAVSGSTIVVGAPCHPGSAAGTCGRGAAYVFMQSGATWTQQEKLTASGGKSGDDFGWSVAVDGSTIVVGAPDHTVGANSEEGAAYVFAQNVGGTWIQKAELTASDGAADDNFGTSVAVSGSTVVVGADNHTVGSNSGQGAAYVFVEGGGTWSQQAELISTDGAAHDHFGDSVALAGSTAVAGAAYHTVGSNGRQGAAYVFAENAGTWTQQAELTASGGAKNDYFGWSVALNGGTAVVGATAYYGASNSPGAACVFVQNGDGTWSQQAEVTASDGGQHSFGYSVSVDGSTAVAGAPSHTVGSNNFQGTAYVFGSSGPSYTLSAAPSNLTLVQGSQGQTTITITPANGFSGSVSFSALGLPTGVTAAFNPNPATSTSTLTLTASGTATTGTATALLTGTSGNLAQTTGLTLTVTQAIAVTFSPSSLSFGSEAVNNTSAAKTVTLKNTGTATLTISGIAASAHFTISSTTCGASLPAGRACKVSVTFTPAQLGSVSGTLSFTDNGPGGGQMVALSGTGINDATLTPASVTFPKIKIGTTSAAKTFTLTNTQPVALNSIAISTTGDFAVSATTCGTSLGAKGECTVSVTFTPTATGTRTGQLSVSDSANNSPQTSNLTGTAR